MAETAVKKLQVKRYKPEEYPEKTYLTEERGFKAWITTLDHKKIGIMYLWTVIFFFLVAGTLAVLLRTELLTPGASIFSGDAYNQLFTLHGAIMVFLFIIPLGPAAFGNFLIPLQLGAKDVAFPKLNLASYHIFLIGSIVLLAAILTGGLDTGWTFYTPYSTQTGTSVFLATTGAFILGFASILTAVNMLTTIHRLRAPGMSWSKLSLFAWSIYATSIIIVLATPVLAITLLLLAMERLLGIGIFDPALGGDPVLYQHFFWFYSHPAVYIMIVPGFGVISELVTTFSRKHIFGYWAIALSSLAIAFISFLVWGHHMFVSGQSSLANMVFSFLTFLVGIPTGIKIFNWVATMYRGSIDMKTPMTYVLSFLFLFMIGGFTGIMIGALSVDVHLHDTYYIVAHFHYVMMGGTVIAMLGGLHYWWPKFFGRMYNELWGKISSAIIFIGFNLTFLPQFVMGSIGMPRRYHTYLEQYEIYHVLSTLGTYVLALGFIIIAINLLYSLRRGKRAPANPWGSRAMEWQTTSPPVSHNFNYTPVVIHGPYDYHQPMADFQLGVEDPLHQDDSAIRDDQDGDSFRQIDSDN